MPPEDILKLGDCQTHGSNEHALDLLLNSTEKSIGGRIHKTNGQARAFNLKRNDPVALLKGRWQKSADRRIEFREITLILGQV